MGPGGLDPLEVLETLPPAMKEAFMAHDVPALHQAVASLPQEEVQYHMDRARKSGLWVDQGQQQEEDGAEDEGGGGGGSAKGDA